jgi:hypothetical protein
MPVLDGAAFIRRFRAQPDRTHVPGTRSPPLP